MAFGLLSFLPSAQEDATQAKADGGDKLAAVLKVESELQAVREQAAEHESELRQELQQARRDKQQAEAKLGGLDLTHMEVCNVPSPMALPSTAQCVLIVSPSLA